MSILATFRAIKKDKLDEYCRMAGLRPKDRATEKPKKQGDATPQVRFVTPEEMKSAEFQKQRDYYKKLWDYLQKNSKEPFQYEWSGNVI